MTLPTGYRFHFIPICVGVMYESVIYINVNNVYVHIVGPLANTALPHMSWKSGVHFWWLCLAECFKLTNDLLHFGRGKRREAKDRTVATPAAGLVAISYQLSLQKGFHEFLLEASPLSSMVSISRPWHLPSLYHSSLSTQQVTRITREAGQWTATLHSSVYFVLSITSSSL